MVVKPAEPIKPIEKIDKLFTADLSKISMDNIALWKRAKQEAIFFSFKGDIKLSDLTSEKMIQELLAILDTQRICNLILKVLRNQEPFALAESILKYGCLELQKPAHKDSSDFVFLFSNYYFDRIRPHFGSDELYFATVTKFIVDESSHLNGAQYGLILQNVIPHLKASFPDQCAKVQNEVVKAFFAMHALIEATFDDTFEEKFESHYLTLSPLSDQMAKILFELMRCYLDEAQTTLANAFHYKYFEEKRGITYNFNKKDVALPKETAADPTLKDNCQKLDRLLNLNNKLTSLYDAAQLQELKIELRKAYKQGALQFHPDKVGPHFEEKFKELHNLYTAIINVL